MRQADKTSFSRFALRPWRCSRFCCSFGSATRAKAAIYWNEESQIRGSIWTARVEPDFILLPKNDESTYFHCGGVAVDGSHI